MENLSLLVQEYAEAAIKHGEATEEGNSRDANKQYKIIDKIKQSLLSLEDEGKSALMRLIDYENPYVKLWSASHSLNLYEKMAIDCLSSLTAHKGLLGFTKKDIN
ncbi:DUF2019 domain-containing protein [Cytobacillus massiliigabonensis]|uniref:DUF2019 domain-containing protein n=1 Tax=Cytobacillus massiliigabonensis TaxID=1871011 RepID=UPI000C840F80|nr:DUF2019 domain-containing protein [Cytobacillus massiliigabonensis]